MASGVAVRLDDRYAGSYTRTSGPRGRPTLFGTTLQQKRLFHDQRTTEEMEEEDDDEEVENKKCQRDNAQHQIHLLELAKERNDLEAMKSKLKAQREDLSQTQNNLRTLEEAYKYFKVDPGAAASSEPPAVNVERHQMSDAVNQMSRGRVLGRRYGVNADSTQPFHLDSEENRWKPVGLPLGLPANNCTPSAVDISTQRFKDSRRLHFKDSTAPDCGSKANLVSLPSSLAERYGTHLPPRIQHTFGTTVCRNLFSTFPEPVFHPHSADVRPPVPVAGRNDSVQEAKSGDGSGGGGVRPDDDGSAAALDALGHPAPLQPRPDRRRSVRQRSHPDRLQSIGPSPSTSLHGKVSPSERRPQ